MAKTTKAAIKTIRRRKPSAAGAAKKTRVQAPRPSPSGEELYRRVQQEAYFLGEKDGFRKDPMEYWLAAEKKVKAQLG